MQDLCCQHAMSCASCVDLTPVACEPHRCHIHHHHYAHTFPRGGRSKVIRQPEMLQCVDLFRIRRLLSKVFKKTLSTRTGNKYLSFPTEISISSATTGTRSAASVDDKQATDDHATAKGLTRVDRFSQPHPCRCHCYNWRQILDHGRLSCSGMFHTVAPHRQG